MFDAKNTGQRGYHLRAFVAEKVFDHLRDFSRRRGCVGRVHGPNYTQNRKTREKKVSAQGWAWDRILQNSKRGCVEDQPQQCCQLGGRQIGMANCVARVAAAGVQHSRTPAKPTRCCGNVFYNCHNRRNAIAATQLSQCSRTTSLESQPSAHLLRSELATVFL
jgi:hypothetical protein